MTSSPGRATRPESEEASWTSAVRAELCKIAAWRVSWFVAILALAISLSAAGWYWSGALLPFPGEPLTATIAVEWMSRAVDSPEVVVYAAILFGALVGTAEWRQRTWAVSFSFLPRRTSLILAKFAAVAAGGCIIAAGGFLCGALVGSYHMVRYAGVMRAHHVPGAASISLLWWDTLRALPTEGFACASLAVLWCGIGLLVRSQTLAALLAVVYPIGVERFLASDIPGFARFLPEWAIQSVAATPIGFTFTVAAGASEVAPLTGASAALDVLIALTIVGTAAWLVLRRSAIA